MVKQKSDLNLQYVTASLEFSEKNHKLRNLQSHLLPYRIISSEKYGILSLDTLDQHSQLFNLLNHALVLVDHKAS